MGIVVAVLFAYLGYMGGVSDDEAKLKSSMESFKLGYHDSYITTIGNLISDCSPEPLVVYQNIHFNGQPIGLVYRCEGKNLSLSMAYSGKQK